MDVGSLARRKFKELFPDGPFVKTRRLAALLKSHIDVRSVSGGQKPASPKAAEQFQAMKVMMEMLALRIEAHDLYGRPELRIDNHIFARTARDEWRLSSLIDPDPQWDKTRMQEAALKMQELADQSKCGELPGPDDASAE